MASTIWRGFITFGLISIPVRLFRAARAERVSFRRLYKADKKSTTQAAEIDAADDYEDEPRPKLARMTGAARQTEPTVNAAFKNTSRTNDAEPVLLPVKQATVQSVTGEAVPAGSLVKGFEYEKGRYVVVDDEELKNLAPKTATEMEILEFVKLEEIDPVYFETSYYVKPEDAGQKAYALLYRSLQISGLVAVARFAMHNREHVVVVRAGKNGIISHTMFFANEVRADEEYQADVSKTTPKELELAQMLIHSLASSFNPEKYHDTYREQLEAMIEAKAQGKTAALGEAPRSADRVIDITDALRKSLANLKKPAQSDERSAPPALKKLTKHARQK